MRIDINHELYAFSAVVVGIMLVCALFDLFREFYFIFRIKGGLRTTADILFWICAAVFTWICLLNADNGRLRFYQAAGGLLGGILYFLALSVPIRFIFKNIFKLFKLILKILLTPARFLYKILYRVFNTIKRRIIRIKEKVRNKKCTVQKQNKNKVLLLQKIKKAKKN